METKRILLGITLLLLSNFAFAQSYHVEIIVFENLQIVDSNEIWNVGNVPNYSNSIELSLQNVGVFSILPPNSQKLGNIKNALQLSAIYRPIHHVAWQQPSLTQSRAEKIRIKNLTAEIDGTVTVISGHLLHLNIDITYLIEPQFQRIETFVQPDGVESIARHGSYARMQEIRRIKLNELHYFDHPLFGMIIQVTRGRG